MFSQEKAAQYFVVAWVKDWSLRTYVSVIFEGDSAETNEPHKHFAWLPHDASPFIRNTRVRRWAADTMRLVNDKLWDAPDNAAKMRLAPLIQGMNCRGSKMRPNSAAVEMRRSIKEMAGARLGDRISIDAMRRGGSAHWSTVK